MSRQLQNTLITVLALVILSSVIAGVAFGMGGDIPALPRLAMQGPPPTDAAFQSRIRSIFKPLTPETLSQATETDSPYFTKTFAPPPKAPPKAKPKTKKVTITFQGFYNSVKQSQKAFLLIDGNFRACRVGDTVTADLKLISLDANTIRVGRSEEDATEIAFRKSQAVEIPL